MIDRTYKYYYNYLIYFVLIIFIVLATASCSDNELPSKESTLKAMQLANSYFMKKWPDVGKTIITDRERASNIWTRAVYYEGLMALYNIDPKEEYYNYAVKWGEFHEWNLRDGYTYTRNADNQCAGQTYIELYHIENKPERVGYIKMSIDSMMNTSKIDDWYWIDAIHMAMPVFVQLGVLYEDSSYFERMHEMYMCTKDSIGGGLYNYEDHLWWRDASFKPPFKEPNGEDCYWSRGNGWVVAALVRVMNILPEDYPYYKEYLTTYKEMIEALVKLQREDGFWNVSLHDPTHLEGKEITGTALFIYGISWGINKGILNKAIYYPVVAKAWNGILNEALHSNGFLGYVQGTGSGPTDGQPVAYDHTPDFEDYGLGCFLLVGTEVYKLTE